MITSDIYECAFKYYNTHNDISSKERINNIQTIFGISRASFFRNFKKNKEVAIKKT